MAMSAQHKNYQRVAQAISYLSAHQHNQPSLTELANHVGVSEFHLQRIFTEWAGLSPKQFLQFLTKASAQQWLRKSSVMDSALACGLSGSDRLDDLMIKAERVTPGEYRRMGAGMEIVYGELESPFGRCFIAANHRGICKMAFFDERSQTQDLLASLRQEWSLAAVREDQNTITRQYSAIFQWQSLAGNAAKPISILLRGSEFQLKVWAALLVIPAGEIRSYQQVAGSIGSPTSVRAVASAIAGNNIAYLIPCHRVIRSSGEFNQYRWGSARKQAILMREASHDLNRFGMASTVIVPVVAQPRTPPAMSYLNPIKK